MKKHNLIPAMVILFAQLLNAQIFVAVAGNDQNSGSIDSPLATIPAAIAKMNPGDTTYVMGGTYNLTSTISISSSMDGTSEKLYHLFAYNNEFVLLDFSAMSQGPRGISLRADYWFVKGLNIKGAGDNGMIIDGGSYNTVEFCSFFENKDTGLQMSNGASYNRIINCDSYYNADPPDYGDADGFAPKLTVGDGNYFYGCRSWGNCDDGWDGYMRGANDITTTLENCWTWGNGYLKDGSNPGSQANGNGFKMGGGDNSNSLNLMHHHILINCVAFNNKAKGFDQNNNVGSMTLYNCSGFDNGTANFRIQKELVSGQTLTVKNSLSYDGSVQLGSFAIEEKNSWLSPFTVSEDDFISIDISNADKKRNADGSLPEIDFLHLAEGSDLIDAGVDLGFAFNGSAPDLGAFESNYLTIVKENTQLPVDFQLLQNYPNPFNPSTTIEYSIPETLNKSGSRSEPLTYVQLTVCDILGNEVSTLVNEQKKPGKYKVKFDGSQLSSGLYIYHLQTEYISITNKMILIK